MTPGASTDAIRLADILTAIDRIAAYTHTGRENFFRSSVEQDAVIRQFEIVGEAAGHLSKKVR